MDNIYNAGDAERFRWHPRVAWFTGAGLLATNREDGNLREPTKDKRRRHKLGAGYVRGEQRRTQIIEGAIEVFGSVGFEGATTRLIAERAGVPAAAIQYYFEGKAGLFSACDAYIADRAAGKLYPALLEANDLLERREATLEQIYAQAERLTDGLIDFLLGSTQTEKWVLFALRIELSGTGATRAEALKRRIIDTLARLIARFCEPTPSETDIIVRALAIYGSIMTFRAAHGLALNALGWDGLGPRRLGVLKDALRRHVRTTLGSQLPQGRSHA